MWEKPAQFDNEGGQNEKGDLKSILQEILEAVNACQSSLLVLSTDVVTIKDVYNTRPEIKTINNQLEEIENS